MSGTIKVIKFRAGHQNISKKVRVKKPRWIPKILCRFFIPNIGKVGEIIGLEDGGFTGLILYIVSFEEKSKETSIGVYFENDLEFF